MINRRLVLAIWLFLFLINSFKCDLSEQTEGASSSTSAPTSNASINGDRILTEQEAESLLATKLDQLSLLLHRKTEGDRIRKKRQLNPNYLVPGDEGWFSIWLSIFSQNFRKSQNLISHS